MAQDQGQYVISDSFSQPDLVNRLGAVPVFMAAKRGGVTMAARRGWTRVAEDQSWESLVANPRWAKLAAETMNTVLWQELEGDTGWYLCEHSERQ